MKNHDGTDSTIIEPGRLQMNRSDIELGGNAKINFTDTRNILYHQSDTRMAGLGVGHSIVGDLPYTFLGAVESGDLNTSETRGFSGFIDNTRQLETNDGIQNSVNGNSFQIRDNVNADEKVLEFVLNASSDTARIIPWNTGRYHYHLGYEFQRFSRGYIDSIYSGGGALIVRNPNSDWTHQGWRLETSYSGSSYLTLRGNNSNDFFNLGADGWRFSNIYSVNGVDTESDERLKDNITDNELGLDFIKDIKTKEFTMRNVPESEKDIVKNGIIAQEIIDVLEKHGKDYKG